MPESCAELEDERELPKRFFEEVRLIRRQWALFERLFWVEPVKEHGTCSREEQEALSRVAPYSMQCLRLALLDAVLSGLCRLTDKDKTLGHANLTLDKVVSLLIGTDEQALAFFRPWRDGVYEAVGTGREPGSLRRVRHDVIAHFGLRLQGVGVVDLEKVRVTVGTLGDASDFLEARVDPDFSESDRQPEHEVVEEAGRWIAAIVDGTSVR